MSAITAWSHSITSKIQKKLLHILKMDALTRETVLSSLLYPLPGSPSGQQPDHTEVTGGHHGREFWLQQPVLMPGTGGLPILFISHDSFISFLSAFSCQIDIHPLTLLFDPPSLPLSLWITLAVALLLLTVDHIPGVLWGIAWLCCGEVWEGFQWLWREPVPIQPRGRGQRGFPWRGGQWEARAN